ncbi:hypothetical protein [Methanohalobium sp.]|uniref:hypothetical protein n=1 Tax=Methanohalobium sp. TaxID=2837493 RepID=UPI0025D2B8AC|nr:hypothetical protein [Methanohalobium sp.]
MTDIMLLWDTKTLFEKLFQENELGCKRVMSSSLGTPFLPPCKSVIIPTGFANPQYTTISSGIEQNNKSFEKFLKNGGIVTVFGPMVSEYHYQWLPVQLTYIQKHKSTPLQKVGENEAQSIIEDLSEPVECDGYFSETDGQVLYKNDENQPVMIVREYGDGLIIATTIHEFPSSKFLTWIKNSGKKTQI